MLINGIAQATGLTIPTIRYYEREGLLNERYVTRQSNGYRTYSQNAVERLRHFKQARVAGLTMAEIKQLAEAYDVGELSDATRRSFLQDKVDELSKKIIVLQEMRAGFEAELESI